jgi:hypothetical protein
MTLAPHPHSTAADLLRLLAAWLAAIVLVQGVAAASALGHGPLHRHTGAASQHHHHDGAERHHHAAGDAGMLVLAEAEPALDEAAFALVAALALMALAVARVLRDARRHVWRAAPAWAWLSILAAPPRRPPRRA